MTNINCIIYPPTLEYHYLVQRPQHLMRSFSELGIPAFFLNNSSTYSGEGRGIRKLNDLFYLVNNVDPAPYWGNSRPVVYYTATVHVDMVKNYNPELIIFDSVDEPSEEFESWRPNYYRAVSSADIVLTASDKLYRMASALNPRTYLVPNACDYDYFSGNKPGAQADLDILNLNKPIIGYIGVIASWCDLDLIVAIADRFPHCNLAMIGPLYNISEVPHRPNLHWLGFKPYEKLAAYARMFDVGIIPFKQTSMTESVNPIKMWEYMATGMPIVTTALPEAKKHGDLVLHSENHEQFMNNLNKALYSDSDEKKLQRQNIAKQNSWLERARMIVEIIEKEMQTRNIIASQEPVFIADQTIKDTRWEEIAAYVEQFSFGTLGSSVSVANKTCIRSNSLQSYGDPMFNVYNSKSRSYRTGPVNRGDRRGTKSPQVAVKKALKF